MVRFLRETRDQSSVPHANSPNLLPPVRRYHCSFHFARSSLPFGSTVWKRSPLSPENDPCLPRRPRTSGRNSRKPQAHRCLHRPESGLTSRFQPPDPGRTKGIRFAWRMPFPYPLSWSSASDSGGSLRYASDRKFPLPLRNFRHLDSKGHAGNPIHSRKTDGRQPR